MRTMKTDKTALIPTLFIVGYLMSPSINCFREWNTEPDDTSGLENCGALNFQGAISDERCADKYSYICEYSIATGNRVRCVRTNVDISSNTA